MSTKNPKGNQGQKTVITPTTQRAIPTSPATANSKIPQRVSAPPQKTGSFLQQDKALVFGRENYKWALIGLGIVALGFILMSGGAMPSPDVWDESLIYSPVRIILAPFLVIAGFCVVVYSIFVKNKTSI